MPLISVVVPVYNAEKYLPDCLNSVLSQTFSDFEVLCVDSFSTDNSFALLNKYAAEDRRIKVFQNDKNGVCQARNKGIDNASGKYLMFLDSDDFIDSKYMEILLSFMEKENADYCSMPPRTRPF